MRVAERAEKREELLMSDAIFPIVRKLHAYPILTVIEESEAMRVKWERFQVRRRSGRCRRGARSGRAAEAVEGERT